MSGLDLYVVVLVVGFFVGCVGGVIGMGVLVILLLVFVWVFGFM